MENQHRELSIRMEEAEKDLLQNANRIFAEYNLPLFLAEPIFANIYRQIRDGKAREIEEARKREAAVKAEEAPK